VSWSPASDGGLCLAWRESGGPPVQRPDRRGFGSELIEASGAQLGGPVRFDWRQEGLVCTVTMTADCIAHGDSRVVARAASEPAPAAASIGGAHVLIVEDDLVLSLAVKRELEDAGCVVVGPAANLEDALALAGGEPLHAAVLDLNLRGQSAMPVAELLSARGVPYLFTTGYSGRDLPDMGRPVIEKPFAPNRLTRELQALLGAAVHPKVAAGNRQGRRRAISS
jgi:CheY-like chemotaxis protein